MLIEPVTSIIPAKKNWYGVQPMLTDNDALNTRCNTHYLTLQQIRLCKKRYKAHYSNNWTIFRIGIDRPESQLGPKSTRSQVNSVPSQLGPKSTQSQVNSVQSQLGPYGCWSESSLNWKKQIMSFDFVQFTWNEISVHPNVQGISKNTCNK